MKKQLLLLFLSVFFIASSFSQSQRTAPGFVFHNHEGWYKYADVFVRDLHFIMNDQYNNFAEFNGSDEYEEYEESRRNFYQLDSVSISEENPDFSSEDGVMYDKNKTTLLFCPQAKHGKLILPKSVRKIQYSAFYKCKYLTAVVLNDSIHFKSAEEFSNYFSFSFSFANNEPSPPIEVSENNPYYISQEGVLYNKDKTQIIYHYNPIKSKINEKPVIHIPNTVRKIRDYNFNLFYATIKLAKSNSIKSIGYKAFAGCGIDTVFLDSITTMSNGAFEYCTNLESVVIASDSLNAIPAYTFSWCTNLESVTISKSIAEIGLNAFKNCICLKEMTVAWDTPLKLKKDYKIFEGVKLSSCTLHVPKGTKKAYKEAEGWKDFGHIVEVQ